MYSESKEQTAALITEGDRLFKEDEAAKRAYEKALPEWERGQEKRELLAVRILALQHTASRETPDDLMRTRDVVLREKLQEEIRAGNALIVPLVQRRQAAKDALFHHNSRLLGTLSSWGGRATSALPSGHVLAIEVERARRQIETMLLGKTSDIVSIIRKVVDRAEGSNIDNVPLFRFPRPADPAEQVA